MLLTKNSEILKEKISKAIENFNQIRSPEAVAELVKIKDSNFLIKFSGHMCYTCGVYDYFEDLVYELEDLGVKSKIKDYKRFNNYFLVEYKI